MKRKRKTFAFQGAPGAFSWTAGRKILGEETDALPQESFDEVFGMVASGAAEYALIPIENTLYGSVYENYDHLLKYEFPIVAETAVRIEHHLIARPGVQFRQIQRAFSHPVALGQCRRFFRKHARIEACTFYDTAGSVKMIMEKELPNVGAVASAAAATLYGGQIVKTNIEDNPQNFTRFFLLSKQKWVAPNADGSSWKTSLVFSASNVPGSLFKCLACFALRDLSLTKIESRPLWAKPWEYLFYVDTLGHSEDIKVQKAIQNLEEMTNFVKVLGTYQPIP